MTAKDAFGVAVRFAGLLLSIFGIYYSRPRRPLSRLTF